MHLGYIGPMFDVLVFVYENYWGGENCPDADHLGRKLSACGFDAGEIHDALVWLDGLSLAVRAEPAAPAALAASPGSLRVYSASEQQHLGADALGFVAFLEAAGVLPAALREIVIERALAAPGGPVRLDDLKVIVLLVYWSLGQEPDALVLDELGDDAMV